MEAAITLREEEFEVLARHHAHQLHCVSDSSIWDSAEHIARLKAIAGVLGKEAVQKIVEDLQTAPVL
jgi:hypothetical protein